MAVDDDPAFAETPCPSSGAGAPPPAPSPGDFTSRMAIGDLVPLLSKTRVSEPRIGLHAGQIDDALVRLRAEAGREPPTPADASARLERAQPVPAGPRISRRNGVIASVAGFVVVGLLGYAIGGASAPRLPWSAPASPGVAPPAETTTCADGPPVGDADQEARAALVRLREGLRGCITHTIHAVPGTSPAVPTSRDALRGGPYSASGRDWSTPVWQCAKFAETAPRRHQIQWQQLGGPGEGMAVAWVDADADGTVDRAYAVHAKLNGRALDFGDVVEIEASHPVLAPLPLRVSRR